MDRRTSSDASLALGATFIAVRELVRDLLPEIDRARTSVSYKPDGSPVTEADIMLESRIEELLRQELKDLTLHGEESYRAGNATTSGWIAVLDPIDGTENFCSGSKLWGLSLSIWRDGGHEGSMLLLPELDDAIVSGSTVVKHRSRITGFSSTISEQLLRQLSEAEEVRITGCSVYNLMNVIRGTFRRFVNPVGAYSWDLLAGLQLALEHGCEVTVDGEKYAGAYLEPGQRYCVDVRHQ